MEQNSKKSQLHDCFSYLSYYEGKWDVNVTKFNKMLSDLDKRISEMGIPLSDEDGLRIQAECI